MLFVQLLEPKWCFIYITGTHAEPGDDHAREQDRASVLCEWFICFKCFGVLYWYIIMVNYLINISFDRMVGYA